MRGNVEPSFSGACLLRMCNRADRVLNAASAAGSSVNSVRGGVPALEGGGQNVTHASHTSCGRGDSIRVDTSPVVMHTLLTFTMYADC